MNSFPGAFNEYGRLAKVAVRGPDLALASDAKIDGEWRALNWHSRPDLGAARREFEAFAAILRRRFWRYSIQSRTASSRTITSNSTTTFPTSCS